MEIVKLKNSKNLKYEQTIAYIYSAIVNGILIKKDKSDTLNAKKKKHLPSRNTILIAFNKLKNRGIIRLILDSKYCVSFIDVKLELKLFVLFDKLNDFKEDLYNTFLIRLGQQIKVAICIHQFKIEAIRKLINDPIVNYSSSEIIPENLESTIVTLQNSPYNKGPILNQIRQELKKYFAITKILKIYL